MVGVTLPFLMSTGCAVPMRVLSQFSRRALRLPAAWRPGFHQLARQLGIRAAGVLGAAKGKNMGRDDVAIVEQS
jgi:hypothetical protein